MADPRTMTDEERRSQPAPDVDAMLQATLDAVLALEAALEAQTDASRLLHLSRVGKLSPRDAYGSKVLLGAHHALSGAIDKIKADVQLTLMRPGSQTTVTPRYFRIITGLWPTEAPTDAYAIAVSSRTELHAAIAGKARSLAGSYIYPVDIDRAVEGAWADAEAEQPDMVDHLVPYSYVRGEEGCAIAVTAISRDEYQVYQ